jgi:5'-3' exonuclease
VLLIDAANVLARANADRRRGHRLAGDSLAAAFEHWLRFLSALTEPQLLVAVFDAPRYSKQSQPPQRALLNSAYLQRRNGRRERQSSAITGTAADTSPPAGDPLRPHKARVEQLGGLWLEAAGGWEGDDGLAAACAAGQQHSPAASLVVASGDTDVQQLLTEQVRTLNAFCIACPERCLL